MPAANIVDVSRNGALVAFDEPIALQDGERAVVSISIHDGLLHTLSRVVRCARGDDFRTYVAFEFESLHADDDERLAAFVESIRELGIPETDENSQAGSARE